MIRSRAAGWRAYARLRALCTDAGRNVGGGDSKPLPGAGAAPAPGRGGPPVDPKAEVLKSERPGAQVPGAPAEAIAAEPAPKFEVPDGENEREAFAANARAELSSALPETGAQETTRPEPAAEAPEAPSSGVVADAPAEAAVSPPAADQKGFDPTQLPKGTRLGVPSTGFFTEERVGDEEDPRYWTKLGFKYAGGVVVFLMIFGSLRAYEKRLEKEAAERRAAKAAADAGADPDPPADTAPAAAAPPAPQPVDTPMPAAAAPPTELGAPPPLPPGTSLLGLSEEEELISAADELRVEEVELEAKLAALRRGPRSSDSDREKKNIKLRLRHLGKEIVAADAEAAAAAAASAVAGSGVP